jgi:hypothetical protein
LENSKVVASIPGLRYKSDVVKDAVLEVETLVSAYIKIAELDSALNSLKPQYAADRDLLSILQNFHNMVGSIISVDQNTDQVAGWDKIRKISWFEKNYTFYNFFNHSPKVWFNNILESINRRSKNLAEEVEFEKYQEAFCEAWRLCLEQLDKLGIRETLIEPYKTIVTKKELTEGWKQENREKRIADSEHPRGMVYGIIKKGIEIDGKLKQEPIVNVYTDSV